MEGRDVVSFDVNFEYAAGDGVDGCRYTCGSSREGCVAVVVERVEGWMISVLVVGRRGLTAAGDGVGTFGQSI